MKLIILVVFLTIILAVFTIFNNGKGILKGILGGVIPKLSVYSLLGNTNLCDITKVDNYCKINIPSSIGLGVYDPTGDFLNNKKISIEHLYISWNSYDQNELINIFNRLEKLNRSLFLTVEPWPYYLNNLTKETLFTDIEKGEYDSDIEKVCTDILNFKGKIFLSWGHEMDQLLTERYAWSGTDGEGYKKAYKHFVDKCRKITESNSDNIYYIWSPVGNKGLNAYWPGSGYVDYISIPIYSYPRFDTDYYGYARNFSEIYKEKNELIMQYNKPIIVSEMGIYSDNYNYKKLWLVEAFNSMAQYPNLKFVLLFNSKDAKNAWGDKYGTPDWTINPNILK